jgi:predicted RNA binding protein YcfA (HicA-like mRNA interferase family)
MKSVRSRDIIRLLESHGWDEVAVRGSHHQFRHFERPGRVTVPHPEKDLPWPTVRSILKQAGLSEDNL